MEDLVRLISSYGVSFVIVAIFLWDYVVNKKKLNENQDVIKSTLTVVKDTTVTISKCLVEIQQANYNIAKSLELLQTQMETTDKKVDKLIERSEK